MRISRYLPAMKPEDSFEKLFDRLNAVSQELSSIERAIERIERRKWLRSEPGEAMGKASCSPECLAKPRHPGSKVLSR